MRKLCWLAAPALLAACAGNDGAPPAVVETFDSAGTQIVSVIALPRDTVRFESPSVRIGATEAEADPREEFDRISDLAVLPDGRIVVVDNRGGRVALFDAGGEWLADLGRRGEGPGEFTAPLFAVVVSDSLLVWDVRQRRMSRFSAEGSFIDAQALPDWPGTRPFSAGEHRLVLEVESGQLMDPAPARGAVVSVSREGSRPDTIVGAYAVPESGWAVLDEAGGGHMINPPVFAVYPPWALHGDILYWLDPLTATIQVGDLATDSTTRVVRLPYSVTPPSDADRASYFQALQSEFGLSGDELLAEELSTTFADLRPPVSDLLVRAGEEIWVASHDPAALDQDFVGAGWDVFTLHGRQLRHVRFPRGYRLIRLHGSRAYGITTLETGFRVVDVFVLESSG